ncbi:MAG: ABC transporter permease [Bacteroidetes bacterium]|nr:ABC transporter permease [Fibrella sp.]
MKTFRQVLESFRFAWQALRSNLLRTTLSLLGVTVGIFAIIAVFTLVDSLERNIKYSLSFVGDKELNVQNWPFEFSGEYKWWLYFQRPEANYTEYRLLNERLEDASAIVALSGRNNVTVKSGNNSLPARVQGITLDYNQIAEIPIAEGRYFAPQEMDASRNVTVIGYEVAQTLFPNQYPIGKTVKIAGLNFVVIGIQGKKGSSVLEIGPSPDRRCLIPYGTFAKLFQSLNPTMVIAVKGYDYDTGLQQLEGEVRGVLRARRSLKPTQEDNFAINRPAAVIKAISGIFTVLTLAGWIIGGFSILIGGFGIANIMFVSVRERTNLIGIQKSLGAKNYFILLQFLFEAVLLSLVGGLAGILLVELLSFVKLGSLDIQLSTGNILLGVGVSSAIGIISGIVPAIIAARLDPVTAIRAK